MTSRDFCYWLQGHFEIGNTKAMNERETEMVKRHLAMVFEHEIDPSFPDAEKLRTIHNPPKGEQRIRRVDWDMPLMC
jgi:hypothetical protein